MKYVILSFVLILAGCEWEARMDCRNILKSTRAWNASIDRCKVTPGCTFEDKDLRHYELNERRIEQCLVEYGENP